MTTMNTEVKIVMSGQFRNFEMFFETDGVDGGRGGIPYHLGGSKTNQKAINLFIKFSLGGE